MYDVWNRLTAVAKQKYVRPRFPNVADLWTSRLWKIEGVVLLGAVRFYEVSDESCLDTENGYKLVAKLLQKRYCNKAYSQWMDIFGQMAWR